MILCCLWQGLVFRAIALDPHSHVFMALCLITCQRAPYLIQILYYTGVANNV